MPTIFNPIEQGAEAEDSKHIAIFGNSQVCGYNMADLVADFALQDGMRLDISAVTYNNMGTSGSMSLRELFKDINTTSDYNELTFGTSDNSIKMKYIVENTDSQIDTFYIFYNRELYYKSSDLNSNFQMEVIAAKALIKMVLENHSNATVKLVVPAPFGENDFRIKVSGWYSTSSAAHANNLNAAKYIADQVNYTLELTGDKMVSVYDLGGQWLNYDGYQSLMSTEVNASVNSFTGYTVNRHPTAEGAYLIACLMYNDITGKCPEGIEVYGRVTESDAQLIQNSVHGIVGCNNNSHTHSAVGFGKVSSTSYVVKNDKVTIAEEKWNALMAEVLAYDARGSWVQYDQTYMNYRVSSAYRERRRNIIYETNYPEAATPQSLLYTDCSNWISAVFNNVFKETTFGDYRTCNEMYSNIPNNTENISLVYHWLKSEDYDDSYKEDFLGTLQPGDIMFYKHPNNEGGHIMLYVGGGAFIHCSGDQTGAGGSDYRLEAKCDLYEHFGGIQIDTLDILLDDGAPRNIFDEYAVCIYRPGYENLTVTENAIARVEGLIGIVAYKETTAPEGVTVKNGDTVTFTFKVKNITEYNRTVTVSDVIPDGLNYEDDEDGTFTATLTLKPYGEAEVSYTVTVTAESEKDILCKRAYINGVKLNEVTVSVGSSSATIPVTEAEAQGALSEVNAKDVMRAAFNVFGTYYEGSGKGTLENVAGVTVYTYHRTYEVKDVTMLSENLFGGQNLNFYENCSRAKDVHCHNLMAGDLILFISRENAMCRATSTEDASAGAGNIGFENAQACIYMGDDTIGYYDAGVWTTVSGTDANALLDRMLGEAVFMIYRDAD